MRAIACVLRLTPTLRLLAPLRLPPRRAARAAHSGAAAGFSYTDSAPDSLGLVLFYFGCFGHSLSRASNVRFYFGWFG